MVKNYFCEMIRFNAESFNLPTVSTDNFIVKVLLVQNMSEYETYAYEWKKFSIRNLFKTFALKTKTVRRIPDIFNIKVFPQKGVLQARKIYIFHIEIKTKRSLPVINTKLNCEFINIRRRRAYQRSILKHDILLNELKEQFIITDRTSTVSQPWIKILNKPVAFLKSLFINCYIHDFENNIFRIKAAMLKNIPSDEIYMKHGVSSSRSFKEQETNILMTILENLICIKKSMLNIRDMVNNKVFQDFVKSTNSKLSLQYWQFLPIFPDRIKYVNKLHTTVPRKLSAIILEKMLFMMIHKEFALNALHLIHRADIRHICCNKPLLSRHECEHYVNKAL